MEGLWEVTNVLSNGTIRDALRPPLSLDYGSQPQPKLQSLVSQERLRLRISNFIRTFIETIRRNVHQNNLGKLSIGVVRESQKLSGHSYIRRIVCDITAFLVNLHVGTGAYNPPL